MKSQSIIEEKTSSLSIRKIDFCSLKCLMERSYFWPPGKLDGFISHYTTRILKAYKILFMPSEYISICPADN